MKECDIATLRGKRPGAHLVVVANLSFTVGQMDANGDHNCLFIPVFYAHIIPIWMFPWKTDLIVAKMTDILSSVNMFNHLTFDMSSTFEILE